MVSDSRIEQILDDWQAAMASGREPYAAELCGDEPELAAAVERRLTVLRRGAAFVGRLALDPTSAPTAPHAPAVEGAPATIGGYRVVGRLGRGGMGEVFRASDPVLRREVAIKVVRVGYAEKSLARERFLREARAAAAVKHDNAVPVYAVGEDDGGVHMVMPLLEGESLDRRLARGLMPPGEVVRIGRQAAAGLEAVHAAGIVHRDLKPSNLWLEAPDDRVKVLDFGIARAAADEALTATGAIIGTPAYMAPEQADARRVDARADLFSLGVVLYECATGQQVFQRDTPRDTVAAVMLHQPEVPHAVNPAVPRALSEYILRLMSKSPADRPQSAAAVARDLAGLEAPPPKSQRTWVALFAVAALLAVAAWFAVGPTREPRPVETAPVQVSQIRKAFEAVAADGRHPHRKYVYGEECEAGAWLGFAPRAVAPGVWALDIGGDEEQWEELTKGYPHAFDHTASKDGELASLARKADTLPIRSGWLAGRVVELSFTQKRWPEKEITPQLRKAAGAFASSQVDLATAAADCGASPATFAAALKDKPEWVARYELMPLAQGGVVSRGLWERPADSGLTAPQVFGQHLGLGTPVQLR